MASGGTAAMAGDRASITWLIRPDSITACEIASAEETISQISKGNRRRNSAVVKSFSQSISSSRNISPVAKGSHCAIEHAMAAKSPPVTTKPLPVDKL